MTTRHDQPVQRVWVDVTMLAGCSTQPTGISRVLLAIVNEWRRGILREVRLCRLDLQAGGFVEVPASILDRFSSPPEEEIERALLPPTGLNLAKHRVKIAAKHGLAWLPRPIKGLLRSIAKNSLRGVNRAVRSVRQRIRQWRAIPAAPLVTLNLGLGDLVVWLGEGWDIPERSALCWSLKKQHGFRIVWQILDLIPIWFPQFFGPGLEERYSHWLVDTLWTADLILADSKNTRADVLRFCLRGGIPSPPVEVIRYGDNFPIAGTPRPPRGFESLAGESFVLCVGSVEARKNHLLLYHVWQKLAEQCILEAVPVLVIAGRTGWLSGDAIYQAQNDPSTKNHIRFATKTTDAELGWLYQNCLFTVYPSFYEGWGLPVAESLAYGKYCIASGVSSIPEIGGDLVGYHDPYSVAECLAQVTAALEPEFRLACEERIRRNYRRCKWSECAWQVADILAASFGSNILMEEENDGAEGSPDGLLPHPIAHFGRTA